MPIVLYCINFALKIQ
uniref:Uncharacterized protein n=1 Tax=Rhizophora mucronata TaxID=61149 RepID=A0A2P2NDA3_RHIMU